MQQLYEQYVLRYRCKIYLEQRFAEVERVETERMQQHLIATRKLVEQLRLEETVPEETTNTEDVNNEDGIRPHRPRPKLESNIKIFVFASDINFFVTARGRSLRGSKNIGNELDLTSGSSSETDTEDVLMDGEEPELLGSGFGSEDDSVAVEISTMETNKRAPTAGRRTALQQRKEDSDDDF